MNPVKKSTVYSVLGSTVLAVALVLLTAYFLLGQTTIVSEGWYLQDASCESLNDGWTSPELDNAEITLPCDMPDIDAGQTFSLSRTLPDIPDETWNLMLWNKGQKVSAYVGGELRYAYSADTSGELSAQVPHTYLFIPLGPADSGKTITLCYDSTTAVDVGDIGEVYIGSEKAEIFFLLSRHSYELVFGLVLLCLGFFTIFMSVFITVRIRRYHPLWLLGVAVCLAALWLFANCRARQFVFPDVGSIRDIAFLVVAIMPVPFIMYLNQLQNGRYRVPFCIVSALCAINFFAIFALSITRTIVLSELFIVSLVLAILTTVVALGTLVIDARKKALSSYFCVVVGIVVFAVCALIQAIAYIGNNANTLSGAIFMIGVAVLVACSVYDAMRNLVNTTLERERAVHHAERLTIEALESLAMAVDANDHYTSGHSERVAAYACMIGKRLGFTDEDLEKLHYKGLLHDIGKIGIPNHIINKPGRLTDEEYATMKQHTIIGDDILRKFTELPYICAGARWHHERWDGKGYPDGLAGEDIPLDARIIATADAYDAMTSNRSYRDALSIDIVRGQIEQGAGSQFDPKLAAIMLELIDEGALDSE